MTATCPTCGETKPLNAFHRDRRRPNGRAVHCSSCKNRRLREYRATPDGRAASIASWHRSMEKARAMSAALA